MDTLARKLCLAAVLALASFTPSAFADSTVYVNGSYAFANNGYGIPPYGGTLNGQPAEFFCVDFTHDISGGDSWQAVVTPVTPGGNYSSTYLQNADTYLEFAYILTEMTQTTNQTTQAEDQWAIWSVTDGGYDPYSDGASILAAAQAAVEDGFNGAGWEVLTPDVGQYGQEFMIYTPEPASWILLALGLGSLVWLKRRQLSPN